VFLVGELGAQARLEFARDIARNHARRVVYRLHGAQTSAC
jgi:hypothetical protein